MTDGSKNVPFALPDEEEQDVFSSVEMEREAVAPPAPAFRNSQANVAVGQRPPSVTTRPKPAAATRNPRLSVESVDSAAAVSVDIDRDLFLIGGNGAHLPLQDVFVSQWHAQLRVEDDAVVLEDMASQNGVYLRIADDLQLEDLDEIVVGNQRFVFRTTWDTPPVSSSPFAPATPALGANPPRDAARLVQLYSGGIVGGTWRIADRLTIGRQGCDVSEPEDPWLSSPHATIERRGAQFYIKDARSQYGTFIRVFDPVELIDGDCFMVGRSRLKITYP